MIRCQSAMEGGAPGLAALNGMGHTPAKFMGGGW
jgi:hypothetical protein